MNDLPEFAWSPIPGVRCVCDDTHPQSECPLCNLERNDMNEPKKKYDLAQLNAELDNVLIRAQEDLEDAIAAYGEASDAYATAEQIYRETRGQIMRTLREEKMPATLTIDIAKGSTAGLKSAVIRAEGQRRRCQMMATAIELRINTLKFIGRRTDTVADGYMEGSR